MGGGATTSVISVARMGEVGPFVLDGDDVYWTEPNEGEGSVGTKVAVATAWTHGAVARLRCLERNPHATKLMGTINASNPS